MSTVYQELADRIRGEVPDLDRVVQRALRAWTQVEKRSVDVDVYLDSVALNLHGFYSGLERLFELIARHIDGNAPTGDTWHRDLLRQMAQDSTEVRPAVIDADSSLALDEFRRFRHLVRNVYTSNLTPGKIAGLITTLPPLWAKVQADLLAFADFLDNLAQASSETPPE